MPLPVYFPVVENVIDETNDLPVVKLSTGKRTAFGGNSFQSYIMPENSGGTVVAAGHVGADSSRTYNTKDDIFAKMVLLYNSHGNVVTPDFSKAITSSDQPFNFAGIALSNSPSVLENWIYKRPEAGSDTPPQRSECQLSYNGSTQKTVLFGGVDNFVLKDDTWIWNGKIWTEQVISGPSARKSFGMTAYTSSSDNEYIFLYGGADEDNLPIGDTWVYNGYGWVDLSLTDPGDRSGHSITFDSNRGKVVLFGGTNGDPLNDTWEYDILTESWSEISPSNNPSSRTDFAMAYDNFRNKVVLFSGGDESDTWEYDGTDWTEVFLPGTLPPARSGAQMVFNPVKKKMVLFGGLDNDANDLSDVWEYDGNTWTEITVSGPSKREYFGMSYDSGHDKIVLFGGANTLVIGGNSETWEFGSPVRPITVQTTGDGYVYYDASDGRPVPVVGDFLGPSSALGTVTPIYDGYSPVFGIAMEGPVVDPNDAPNPLQLTVDGSTVGMIKMRIRSFYGFIPPTSPTISNFSPSAAKVGETVTVEGSVFIGTTEVTVDGYSASFSVISNNQLTLTVASGTQQGAITVVNPQGNSTSITDFSTLPTILSVFAPVLSIGSAVTIYGYTLAYTTSITFNGVDQPVFTVVNDSEVTTTIPAGGTTGDIEVTITYPSTDEYTVTYSDFSVVDAPFITNVAPLTGPIGSAAFTLLNGSISDSVATITVDSTTGFLSTGTLYIDSEQITYTATTAYTFTGCTRGANDTTAASHTDNTPVNSADVNPAGYVSILGSGFSTPGTNLDGYGVVEFVPVTTGATLIARRTVFNDTTISVVVPNPGIAQPSKNYYVRITTNGGVVTSTQEFTIIPIPKFYDAPGPTFISQSDDAYGEAGDTVRILGDYGFTGLSRVTFSGYPAAAISFHNDGYITAVVPTVDSAIDVSGPISVTSTGGTKSTADSPTTAPINFTILQAPVVTSISPTSGKTGDSVSLFGTNLLAVSSVKFAGTSSTAVFTIVNSGRINVTVPSSSSGITQSPATGVITVHKGAFDAYCATPYQYYPPPTITSYSPVAASGINAGYGTVMTVNGTQLNQGGTPTITVGGVGATTSSVSSGSLMFTVPSGANNGVTLTTAGGPVTISPFVILKPVSISSFYTENTYDHHSAGLFWYSSDNVDVYGSNFTSSMLVYISCPALGYATTTVGYTFYDSTHFRFNVATLGSFISNYCNINIITYFPGGSYSAFTTGLFLFTYIG